MGRTVGMQSTTTWIPQKRLTMVASVVENQNSVRRWDTATTSRKLSRRRSACSVISSYCYLNTMVWNWCCVCLLLWQIDQNQPILIFILFIIWTQHKYVLLWIIRLVCEIIMRKWWWIGRFDSILSWQHISLLLIEITSSTSENDGLNEWWRLIFPFLLLPLLRDVFLEQFEMWLAVTAANSSPFYHFQLSKHMGRERYNTLCIYTDGWWSEKKWMHYHEHCLYNVGHLLKLLIIKHDTFIYV